MERVQDKVALVTGATGGIGRVICQTLAREGATVFGVDLAEALPFDDVEWKELGITYLRADISREQDVETAVGAVLDAASRVDVLVNNAGIIGPAGPSHLATQEAFDRLFAVNVRGPWLCTKYAVASMLRTGGGSIIDISSINGIVGGSGIPLYHASKGAVRLMAKADAITYAKDGIRVNSIHPGSITSPMSAAVVAARGDEYEAELIAAHPLGRRGRPEDIANGALYLASDESEFVTGAELIIDGGYTAR